MEDWRVIPTFPKYEICKDGRIRNIHTGNYVRIHWVNGFGVVFLSYKGKPYGRSVQRLLEKIFDIKPEPRIQIVTKCPNCGLVMGKNNLIKHLEICKLEERDPNIEYFKN